MPSFFLSVTLLCNQPYLDFPSSMPLAKSQRALLGNLSHSTQSSQWPTKTLGTLLIATLLTAPQEQRSNWISLSLPPTHLPHCLHSFLQTLNSLSAYRISGCPRFMPGLASVERQGVAQIICGCSQYKGHQRLSNLILPLGALNQETPFKMVLFRRCSVSMILRKRRMTWEFFCSVNVVLFLALDIHYLHCLEESQHFDSSGRSRISYLLLHTCSSPTRPPFSSPIP